MKRLLGLSFLLLSNLTWANSKAYYQVDIVIFSHLNKSTYESSLQKLKLSEVPAVALKVDTKAQGPYQILPNAKSQLRDEALSLNRKAQYRVLFQYSWLQPNNSQRAITLPALEKEGWEISGVIRIQKGAYYSMDAELKFFPTTSNRTGFIVTQSQRLKPGVAYYLDHPNAGMLIKVHPLV